MENPQDSLPQSPDGDSSGQPQDPQLPRDTRKLSRLRYEAITSSSCAITLCSNREREFWRIRVWTGPSIELLVRLCFLWLEKRLDLHFKFLYSATLLAG